MNLNKITQKVTEAIALDREIAELTERLKAIKAELVKAADSDLMDKTVTDGGGWSVSFDGVDGSIARVTQPGQKLKASISGDSTNWEKIKAMLGRDANVFFKPVTNFAPCADFRKLIAANYSTTDERKLLKLVESNSSPTVSFETKETA